MISTSELFKSKPLPKWISSHPVFKEVDKIKKVFPNIGLNNSEGDCIVDNTHAAKKSAKALIRNIRAELNCQITVLKNFKKEHPKLSSARKEKIEQCIETLKCIKKQTSIKGDCILTTNGKITLNLPSDITLENESKPLLKKGEGLFKVYNKVNDLLKENKFRSMEKLDQLFSFKEFSSNNIPNSRFKIVFSSEGANGIWDIATMSMRGISSCQSWAGEYKHCLIGSLIDPFVGIIYLTSGGKFNEYGSKMMRRCVVRFAIDKQTKTPVIVLDNMYPDVDTKIVNQFKDFIKSKTNNKFSVIYAPGNESSLKNTYMPLTEVRKILQTYGPHKKGEYDLYDNLCTIQSYQDYRLKNSEPGGHDEQAVLFNKNSKKKERKFADEFKTALNAAIKDITIADLPKALKPALKKLKGDNKHYWNQNLAIFDLGQAFSNAVIKIVDKKSFQNSDTYMRRVYYSYFLNKNKIVQSLKAKFSRDLNGKLELKTSEKLQSAQVVAMLDLLLPKIDVVMKKSLMELVEKRKEKFSGALPLPG